MTPEATKALRDLSKMRLQYRRDSEAIAAGIAAFKRAEIANQRRGCAKIALEEMRVVEVFFDRKIEECDKAAAIIRANQAEAER